MATPAYKFIDRRGAGSYWQTNQLIQAATQNSHRQQVPLLDYDQTRNVSSLGRRTLMSMGRYLYENFGPIRGAIDEMARFSVGTYIAQYVGRNAEWGKLAEQWLLDNDRWIDLKGFAMPHIHRNLVIGLKRDGEIGVLLTQDAAGNPKLQLIPSHRIGMGDMEQVGRIVKYSPAQVLEDGTALDADRNILGNIAWEGLALIDGVIVDDYGTPKAYRINYGNPGLSFKYRDISTNDMFLVFVPNYPDQVRGISPLAVGAFDCLDLKDSRRYEMFAQLINASFAVQIKNETGTVDEARQILSGPSSDPDATTGAATDLPKEFVQPGQILYFKNGQGGIEEVSNNRPSVNVMNFQAELMRSALAGIGWPIDFSLDPTKVGGAPGRVVVEKINASIAEIQTLAVGPARVRIDSWRIAKTIKRGILPADEDWWKWEHQGPAAITADAKYDSDIDINENRAGFTPMKRIAERRGEYWEDVQDQCIQEEKRLQERCKAEGVDPNRIKLLTPNGNANIDAQQQQKNGNTQEAD